MSPSSISRAAHQVCKSHVGRNTDALVDELSAIIQSGQDPSLSAMNIKPEQALADLAALKEMIHTRQPEDQARLEASYLRYADAPKPGKHKKHCVAYRMRNLFRDRWNLWPRLCFYRNWKDECQAARVAEGMRPSIENSMEIVCCLLLPNYSLRRTAVFGF